MPFIKLLLNIVLRILPSKHLKFKKVTKIKKVKKNKKNNLIPCKNLFLHKKMIGKIHC